MRTNNFSSKKIAKSLAIVTLLSVCFVFAFAMTWSLASLGGDSSVDTALASSKSPQGGTTAIYGDNGNPLNFAQIGFDGFKNESGTYFWAFTESFDTKTISTGAGTLYINNDSSGGTGLTAFSYDVTSDGPGGYSWSAEKGSHSNIQLGVVHYRVPNIFKNIASNFTVTATVHANVSYSTTGGAGIKAATETLSGLSGFYQENGPAKGYENESVTVSTGTTYLILGFWGYKSNNVAMNGTNDGSVSDISVTFTISTTNASTVSSKCKEAFEDGNKVVAQSLYENGVTDSYTPYNNSINSSNTTNGITSTWPVWYDSIKSNLSGSVDSVSGGKGTLASYTNKSLGSIGGQNYYKQTVINYVGTYQYAFPYSSGTCTGTDGNTTFAVGVDTVQVGDPDGATEGDGNGAVFVVKSMSDDATQSKAVYVENEKVGYATVKRVSRVKVQVTTYVYKNADISTSISDTGYTSTTEIFKIVYKGIDTQNPNAMTLDTSDNFATTNVTVVDTLDANGKLNLNWWRMSTYTNDVNYDELEEEVAPYIWFYRVDRADDLATLKTIPARTYADYAAIKTAGLEPFAYGSLDSFEYDFVTGTTKGIGDVRLASVDSATNAKKSGYYRFTFYTVDLAGNMGTTMTYYVKADYDRPTFDTMIKFDPNGDDSWVTIDSSTNGTWATGETKVFINLVYDPDTKSYTHANGVNISGNTLVFEAGADVFGVIIDENNILKRIEGSQYIDVNATTTTFSKKVETDADKVKLKIDYDSSNGRLIFSFPDAPNASGQYPNIDWPTSFAMYAGQFYEDDDSVSATDGWSGGVKIRVDRNNPETPEIENEEGEYISTLSAYSTNISKANRVWFTESGLRLDAVLKFADSLAENYGNGVKVYIGMKTVTSDADFEAGTYNLVHFAQNYKTIPASDYSNYFGTNLTYVDGGNLDEGDTAITLRLNQTDGAGMRAIFVWAVDQAGNISDELSKYFVLADETTYTVTSSVKQNAELPSSSATLAQANAEDDYSTSFKRGDVITFSLEMDTELYAPYLFTRTDGSSSNLIILSNYSAAYDWLVTEVFEDNIDLDNGSLKITYTLDDYTTVEALSTMANNKITFEFAHRKIVEYTVTNSTSVPFTNAPTVVEMATDDAARSSFEYFYLDNNGDPMGVPVYPNGDNESYKVAIYIPTDNPSFVVKNIVTKEEATGVPTVVDGYLEVGYQKVAFINYTIVKGNVTITAISSSTNYGAAVALDYTLTGLDKADAISKGFVVKLKLNADSSDYSTLGVGDYQIIKDGKEVGEGSEPDHSDEYAYVQAGHPNFLQYYNVNYISAFHKIYTRPITISTVASDKIYGNADPDFKFVVNVDQFEDDAQLVAFFAGFTQDGEKDGAGNYTFWSDGIIKRGAGENVGEYSYVANPSMFDVNVNYSLSITNTAKFNITKRAVELIVGGQYLVKQASESFDPSVDYAGIVPTFTLSTADAQFANQIGGALALDSVWTDAGATTDYDHQYRFTVVLGTIASSNMTFTLSSEKTFTVYIVAADAVIIKLRSGKSFNFVYGTPWTNGLVQYSFENFEGLEDGCEVSWTAAIDGYSMGNVLDVGSYRVNISNIAVTKDGDPISKVYVDSFNVTFTPAIVGVRPTATKLVKAYGAPDSEFGFGWEIATINGEAVGSEYAGNSVASIKDAIDGAYARALYNAGTFESLGTRYDDAANASGVLYGNANKYYAYAVGAEFVSHNPNFAVDATLGTEDAAIRFEITRKELVLNSTMFTGLNKVVDGSVSVNYDAASVKIVELRDMLVLATDEVNLTFTSAYYDDPSTGDRTITFEGLYLAGAKAANYILTVTDLVEGKVTIAYIDNASGDTSSANHIKIIDGLIGLHKSDITIKKQYDGTKALDISHVSIQNRTENNIGTSMLLNIMANGDAEVKSGEFTGSAVNNAYVLSVVLFFKVADPDIIFINDYEEAGLTVEKTNLDSEWGVRVAITGIGGEIEKRVINSTSFASITPKTRDYNSRKNVEIEYVYADGAIVAGDNVTVTFAGEITTDNVGYGEHPIKFTDGTVSNVNYRVDIDELNAKYNEASPLKVQIERAKLKINKSFKSRAYNGATGIEFVDGYLDGYANDFTTINYSTELQAELSTFTIGAGAVEYNLSSKGVADPNVVIDRNGIVCDHDVLIHGLEIVGDAEKLANYEIYGYRYTGSGYMAVGSIPAGVIEDFELLDAVLISKKHISIVENNINVHDKVYDGTKNASATIDVNELSDVVAGDKPYLEITAHGEFDQKYVGYNVNVRISGVTLRAVDQEHEYLLQNYEITNASDVVLLRKIYARPVTFSFNLGSRVYSGDTYVSANVIKETIVGLLPIDVKSYGIQVAGGAYFLDKNVEFEENENGEYKKEADAYIALTSSELETYAGTRYSVGSKQGTVYNPVIKNTKAIYINYALTYSVAKADYVSGAYTYVKMKDGSILHYTDTSIDDENVEEYYFELKKAKAYILASDDEKLAAAKAANAIVGYYNVSNQSAYLVVDGYAGETSGELADYVNYSNDARGKIQKRAAIINEIQVLDDTHFTKDYDGTTKFFGEAGVDYEYASTGMGLAGDDLTIVGVVAEFESASVGDTYVVIRADRLGGADANNYTYGTLRSARIPAKINKIKITAHLADGNMVYGTNLANVKGDITYTLGGKALDFTDNGVMIKFEEFLKVVGILGDGESIADLTEDDMRDMQELLQRIYLKEGDAYSAEPVAFNKDSEDADKYYARLGGNFASLPKTSVLFPGARPNAGTVSTSYTLKGGEAANFAFEFDYTDGTTSHLTVVKRDIYVVAAIEDYQKEYGGIDPAITLNYLDAQGKSAIVSGETWRNVFVKNGVDYRPFVYFSIFNNGVSDLTKITETAKVNSDPTFNGDYVLVIKGQEGFESINYDVHYGEIILVNPDGVKNEKYAYTFDGTSYTAKAPQLTINMPTISGISLASKDGDSYKTTYNRYAQAKVTLVGVKDTDIVKMVDANDNDLGAINAGTYEGIVVLERQVKAAENDPNGYKLIWRSDVAVKLEIAKASPGLAAPRGSLTYDGNAHKYPYTRATTNGLRIKESFFTTKYMKKVEGDYVEVPEMRDSGVYLVYLTYDCDDPNYEVQTIEIQFAITKAKVVVDIDYTARQLYLTGMGYKVDYTISSISPATTPALLTDDDLMVQFLLSGQGLLKLEDGQVVPIDESVIRIYEGKYVFGSSGRYPFQIILKDSSQKENYDITQNVTVDGKTTSTPATGTLELVVTELQQVVDQDFKASIKAKDADNLDKNLLADKFEARFVYKNNVLADDDAYYSKVDSAFMADIEDALGTSVTISAIIRYNLTLAGNSVGLNGNTTTIRVQLTEDVLENLDSTIIYQTVLNSDGTTALKRLSGYEIRDGVLIYDTTSLGSIVFVKAGRETPMLAIWIAAGVVGGIAIIVAMTVSYIAVKKRRLKKELL